MVEAKSVEDLLRERARLDAELERFQRLLTVMFTDIAGSTKYFEKHGDLAGLALLSTVNDRLQPLVSEHKGTVVKTIGDAIMAHFENPIEASRCAIQMQRAIVALNQKKVSREPIQIRVALNVGVGMMKGHDVFGDVVNVCSRIEHETPAGRIGASPSVVEAVSKEEDIAFRKIGTVTLRGKEQEMEFYEILWREEDKGAGEKPAKMSSEQLAMATGTRLEVAAEVRDAIAKAMAGSPQLSHLAAQERSYALVEETPGGAPGKRLPLSGASAVVGREKGELVFPDDPQMAPQHARFTTLGGAFYVEDLGSPQGTFVRIRKAEVLKDGDVILLARRKFRLRLLPSGEAPTSAELVQFAEGGLEEKRFPLQRGENTFGRSQGTYTFPDDGYLSRRHACLSFHGPHCVLKDFMSTNGTFIQIRERHLLDVDDSVLIGNHCLRVLAEPG